jgi:hypothetical protein
MHVLLNLAAALLATAATAQQLPTPSAPAPQQPTTQGLTTRPQAPVGHRQPRLSDLPPEVAHKEQQPTQPEQEQDPIDQYLRICRAC